jgi:hypothetical protein
MSQKSAGTYTDENESSESRPERRTSDRRTSEINKRLDRLAEAIESSRKYAPGDLMQDRIELTGELPGGMKGSAKAPGHYVHVLVLCFIAAALAFIGLTVKAHHDAEQSSTERIAKAITSLSEVMRMQVCFSTLTVEERISEFKYPTGRCKMAGDR